MKTKIAIIGTGIVGKTFAARLTALGFPVMMGTRSVKEKMETKGPKDKPSFSDWITDSKSVKLGSFAEAAKFGDLIINVTQGAASIDALKAAGEENIGTKTLMDVSNPLDFSRGMPPCLIPALSNTNSLGEEIQKTFPNAKVVKTLNTMSCAIMVNPESIGQGTHTNYICGNDARAKEEVTKLLTDLGWTKEAILDLGPITSARGTEAVLPLWLRIWGATQNSSFNVKIVN